MNSNVYVLKPQEIRNAIFMGAASLQAAISSTEELTNAHEVGESGSFLGALGVISGEGLKRMQDVQLTAELLLMLMRGVTHRRDDLDEWFETYQSPTGDAARKLAAAKPELIRVCKQLWALTDGTTLNAYPFPSSCENDFYALVGAIHERGLLTAPQLEQLRGELIVVISGFRAQVEEFIDRVRSGESTRPEEFDAVVETYGRTFLGGQINSKQRREDRIRVWKDVINGVAATLDPRADFTPLQRRLIWAKSVDKVCARCGNTVEWAEFHAGHKLSHAQGGKTVVENGQVEHGTCNQSAGAR